MTGCPECRDLGPGQLCVFCHAEASRQEHLRGPAAEAAEDQAKDDADWIAHRDWCVPCRRDSYTSRAILRARCLRWREWGGPTP